MDAEVPLATKGSILRPSCYAKFKDIIGTCHSWFCLISLLTTLPAESVYDRYASIGTNGDSSTEPKLTYSPSELESYLTRVVYEILGDKLAQGLTTETDLFNFGVDSLQGARIRMKILKEIDVGNRPVGLNGKCTKFRMPTADSDRFSRNTVVYENPSILKSVIYWVASGTIILNDLPLGSQLISTLSVLDRR